MENVDKSLNQVQELESLNQGEALQLAAQGADAQQNIGVAASAKQQITLGDDAKQKVDAAQGAGAQQNIGAPANTKAYKFKDVNELIKAYNSLEAEFTRRSQRLKQLEGAANPADAITDIAPQSDTGIGGGESAQNQAQQNSHKPNENDAGEGITDEYLQSQTANFIKKYPNSKKFSKEIATAAAERGDYSDGFLERAYLTSVENKLSYTWELLNNADKLKEYVFSNNHLKEAVIQEYLSGFNKNNYNFELLLNTGTGITMPPKKPTTIAQAGEMAREILIKK